MTNKTLDTRDKQAKVAIQLDDDIAQGIYTNLMLINHSENEFVMDFVFLQPQAPKAKVRTRLITSPRHTKRLLQALQENVAKYEQKFGIIEVTSGSPSVGTQFH